MKKFIAYLLVFTVLSSPLMAATGTDAVDGHYWGYLISDIQKRNFLIGYLLGIRHEMDLVNIFTGYVIHKNNSDLADELVDFLNNDIRRLHEISFLLLSYIRPIISILTAFSPLHTHNLPFINFSE